MDIPPWAPTLTDGVVTLRAHRPGDADGVLEQARDEQMQRWTSVPAPYGYQDAAEWIGSRRPDWEAGRNLALAIECGGRFAGSIDFRPDRAGAAEVGYGLGPWARGQGMMSRALRLYLPWGFRELGLEVVHWRAAAGNWPSRRAAWAVGFRVEGLVRGLLADRGSRQDGWIGSLRRTDPLSPAHSWHTPPVIQDARVQLRAHRPEDLPRMVEAAGDPLTRQWLPAQPSPYTAADAAAHLEDIREQQAGGHALYWAVADPGDSRLVGEIGMFGLSSPSRSGELGYWAHPDSRGRGLTTAGVRLAARHALLPLEVGGLGMTRLVIRAAAENEASQRVALSAGFRPAGRDRCAERLRDGTLADLLRFELIAADLDRLPVPGADHGSWDETGARPDGAWRVSGARGW
ncbi:MAG TPA: GNAT family N-acetyltransferase [Kineosporiaceae bacterium]|nr:GNAT family N-acetyltransferase [Kineosporiaceae bacterium]